MDRISEKEFLEQYDINQYDRPSLAADIVVFAIGHKEPAELEYRRLPQKKLRILMVQRAQQPFMGAWALPGGFMRRGETIYETARRELKEETGTDKAYLELCNVFSDIGRDPRGWIISETFMAVLNREALANNRITAGSDAGAAGWFDVSVEKIAEDRHEANEKLTADTDYALSLNGAGEDNVRNIYLKAVVREHKEYMDYHGIVSYQVVQAEGIAFDHARIILCAFLGLQDKLENDMRMVFDFMPQQFTLTDLQEAVELILGKTLIKPNFRRKIADYVKETGDSVQNGGHRPPKAYERRLERFF